MEIIKSIKILIQAGFFQQYTGLSASQIYDTLHQQRIKGYSEIFEHHYDPGMDLSPYEIASLDEMKMVYFDTEAGVMNGNNVYVDLIERFSIASDGQIQATHITELWETDNGPITVSFQSKGDTIVFHPEFIDDWVADEIFRVVASQIKGEASFYVCIDEETGMGEGQDVGIMRLTQQEKQFLEKIFGWKFHKL